MRKQQNRDMLKHRKIWLDATKLDGVSNRTEQKLFIGTKKRPVILIRNCNIRLV